MVEAHASIKTANLSVSFRSSTKSGVPADSVESCSVEEALSLTSTGLALTSTGLEVSLVRPGTAAYVGNKADMARPKRLIGRGYPKLGAAWSTIRR